MINKYDHISSEESEGAMPVIREEPQVVVMKQP